MWNPGLNAGGKVRFRLSQHHGILLFIAGELQKLDGQKYASLESSFHKLLKIQPSDTLNGPCENLALKIPLL